MLARPHLFALALTLLVPAIALADAGAVRISERRGERKITVFTDPTPVRVGAVDFSVLVQDIATGSAVMDDQIDLRVRPRGATTPGKPHRASSAAATNRLFQAAHIELPHAGWWEVTLELPGEADSAPIVFELEVLEPLPPWQALWPWFCWPFLAIALFTATRR